MPDRSVSDILHNVEMNYPATIPLLQELEAAIKREKIVFVSSQDAVSLPRDTVPTDPADTVVKDTQDAYQICDPNTDNCDVLVEVPKTWDDEYDNGYLRTVADYIATQLNWIVRSRPGKHIPRTTATVMVFPADSTITRDLADYKLAKHAEFIADVRDDNCVHVIKDRKHAYGDVVTRNSGLQRLITVLDHLQESRG